MRQDENTAILSRSFGHVADEYNRLRSGPSSEALDWLLPEDATDVLEIGAGTGILTRLLADGSSISPPSSPTTGCAPCWPWLTLAVELLAGHGRRDPGRRVVL